MTSLPDFEALLRCAMGLDATTIGSATVERAIRRRMEVLGLPSIEDYGLKLQSAGEELQELIEEVVVPETWFFRDAEAFAAMNRLLVEERLSGRPFDVLRLLSIPCSTGEEPYSMVMALLDAGVPLPQIKIDAVDISVRALEQARRGVYGRNSFRGADTGFRDRYFRSGGNGFALADPLLTAVTFHSGNLVSNAFSRPGAPYDVIFCRNLLIYLDRPTQESVMKILGSALSPSGFLFVGPAEAFLAASSGFTSVNRAMSFAFRKSQMRTAPPAATLPPFRLGHSKSKRSPAALFLRTKATPAREAGKSSDSPSHLAEARRWADLGRLEEATGCCEKALADQGPSAEIYYLLGVIQDAGGDRNRAADHYRRVVYLDPDHIEALTHLALLLENQGDNDAARRLRERAQRVSQKEFGNA